MAPPIQEAELRLIANFTDAIARFSELYQRWRETVQKIEAASEGADIDALEDEAAALATELQRVGEVGYQAMRVLTSEVDETEESLRGLPVAAETAQDGIEKLVAAFEKVATAKGPAEQQRALEELARTYVETGRTAAASFEAGGLEAEALTAIIDEVEEHVATMGSGIESALARGNDAWAKLEKSMSAGGEGIQQRLVALQQAIRGYTAELERAEAAGEEVTAEHREQLELLNEAYGRGTKVAGEYRAAQQQVARDLHKTTEAAGGQGRALLSIDDLLRTSGHSWGRYAVNVTAVIGTFSAFYRIGTKLRDVLNEITSGGFDDFIQKAGGFDALARLLTGATDELAQATERYTNNLIIAKANGIDPTKLSVIELDRAVTALGQKMQAQGVEANAAAAAQRTWEESLDLSKEALDRESAALAKHISAFADANKETLSLRDIKGLLGDQVQRLLDLYDRLDEDAPPAIAQLAKMWGLVPTPIKEARVELEAFVEAAKEAAEVGPVDFTEFGPGAEDAAKQAQSLTGESQKLRREIEALEGIPNKSAEELVAMFDATDRLAKVEIELADAIAAAAPIIEGGTSLVEDHGRTVEEATGYIQDLARKHLELGNITRRQAASLGVFADEQDRITLATERQPKAFAELSREIDTTGIAVTDLAKKQAGQLKTQGDINASLGGMRERLDVAGAAVSQLGKVTEESLASSVEGWEKLTEEQKLHIETLTLTRKAVEAEAKKMAAALATVEPRWVELNRLCEEHRKCLTS